jgi:hypothetical protein
MRDGRGKFTTSDGSTLSGEFKEGKFIK